MLDIIPQVKSCKIYGGDVAMERQPKIICCEGAEFCEPLARKLFQNVCPAIKPDFENAKVTVSFVKDDSVSEEGYRLDVNGDVIRVEASGVKGWTYALITLRQIMKADDEDKPFLLECPCCRIEDEPRCSYRGFMLDEARNFLGENTVKRVLNLMSFYKLNVLHWHLSDDQGYRIESKKFPELNRIASRRNDTQVGGFGSAKFAGCKHEGYYSQNQIKKLIAFAKERNIDVQPEIDLPGHISALTAALSSRRALSASAALPMLISPPISRSVLAVMRPPEHTAKPPSEPSARTASSISRVLSPSTVMLCESCPTVCAIAPPRSPNPRTYARPISPRAR